MSRDLSVTMYKSQTFAVTRDAALSEAPDAAGSLATNATMVIGDTFTGTLTSGDRDWVAVDLVAGKTYVFSVYGTGGSGGVRDTMLVLRDGSGVQIDVNYDVQGSVENLSSMLSFTPTNGGRYYLEVGAERGAGQYTLRTSTDVLNIE